MQRLVSQCASLIDRTVGLLHRTGRGEARLTMLRYLRPTTPSASARRRCFNKTLARSISLIRHPLQALLICLCLNCSLVLSRPGRGNNLCPAALSAPQDSHVLRGEFLL